jgi:hypothetical protein
MQPRDSLQLLPSDLTGALHLPGLDLRVARQLGLGPSAAAGGSYHGIDCLLVQLVLHKVGLPVFFFSF